MSVEHWVGVAVLSQKYCITIGLENARVHLLNIHDIDPSFMLRLAWDCKIPEFIEPSMERLLALPYSRLEAKHMLDLVGELSAIIISAREDITHHRARLISHAEPLLHSLLCPNSTACSTNWPIAYGSAVRMLANPDRPMSGRLVLQVLEAETVPGVHSECFQWTIRRLCDSKVFWKEEEIVALATIRAREIIDRDSALLPRRHYI